MQEAKSSPNYAGFWVRFIADCLDSTLLDIGVVLLVLMVLGVAYWTGIIFGLGEQISFWDALGSFFLQIVLVSFRCVLGLGYYTYAHYRFGTTLGKRVFKIRVLTEKGHQPISLKQSWIRTFGYAASYAPMLCGFLMAAFHPEKRALHDLIAGTVSIVKDGVEEPIRS